MTGIRIVIADDHSLFRDGLKSLLAPEKDIFFVGEAQSGKELIKKYFELRPDIILVDISMPVLSGTEAVIKIREKDPDVKALFLSMHEGEEYIYYTLKAGGKGLIGKNIIAGELVYAIKTVLEGNLYYGSIWTPKKLDELVKRYDTASNPPEEEFIDFSSKEHEVLMLIGEALTSNEIADRLGISKRTIDAYRVKLMQKLDIKTAPELIRYAIKYKNNKEIEMEKQKEKEIQDGSQPQ